MTANNAGHRLSQLSFYYLASYLLGGGLGLLAAPQVALKLLLSSAPDSYGVVMPRLAGLLMIGLGILIAQIIRHDIHVLYVTAVFIRVFFLAVMGWLYTLSRDPLFLVLMGVVGLGMLLTTVGYALDARSRP